MPKEVFLNEVTASGKPVDNVNTPCEVFGIRCEVKIPKNQTKINGKAMINYTIKNLQKSIKSNDNLIINDAFGKTLPTELEEMTSEEIENRFCARFMKRRRIVVFGLVIESNITFVKLRERSIQFLQETKTYIKLHNHDFDYGAMWNNVGFLMDVHPAFGPHREIQERIISEFTSSWNQDVKYWTNDKKQELIDEYNQHYEGEFPFENPPIAVQPNYIVNNDKGKNYTQTYATSIMVPTRLTKVGKMILDYLFFEKENLLKNFIPMAYQNEDPEAFRILINQHNEWLDNHRSLKIGNIPDETTYESVPCNSKNPMPLRLVLLSNSKILGVKFDRIYKRLIITIHKEDMSGVIQWCNKEIETRQYEYNPTVLVRSSIKKLLGDEQAIDVETDNSTSGETQSTFPKRSYAGKLAIHKTSQSNGDTTDNQTDARRSKETKDSKSTRRRGWGKSVPQTINFIENNDYPYVNGKTARKVGKGNQKDNPNTHQEKTNSSDEQASPDKESNSDNMTRPIDNDDMTNESTIDKETISTLTSRYEKQLDDMRNEFKRQESQQEKKFNKILNAITSIETKQKELDSQMEINQSRDQKMDKLIAFFEAQTAFVENKRPTTDELFVHANKRQAKTNSFKTPEKTPPAVEKKPNPRNKVTNSPNRFADFLNDDNDDSSMSMGSDNLEQDETPMNMDDDETLRYLKPYDTPQRQNTKKGKRDQNEENSYARKIKENNINSYQEYAENEKTSVKLGYGSNEETHNSGYGTIQERATTEGIQQSKTLVIPTQTSLMSYLNKAKANSTTVKLVPLGHKTKTNSSHLHSSNKESGSEQ
jgi:hypothetical protein